MLLPHKDGVTAVPSVVVVSAMVDVMVVSPEVMFVPEKLVGDAHPN